MLDTLLHRAFGTVLTSAGSAVGVAAGSLLQAAAILPVAPGVLSTALGVVGALMAAMSWVDKRIEARIAEHAELEQALDDKRAAELLRRVEEIIRG